VGHVLLFAFTHTNAIYSNTLDCGQKRGQATFSGRNRLSLLVDSTCRKSSLSPFLKKYALFFLNILEIS
jgi:hypothetical protein